MFARLALAIVFCGAVAATALAQSLPKPEGDVILTVSGNIDNTNVGDEAAFDLAMLEALPATEFETETLWTDGTHTFRGVTLGALMDAVGADGSLIRAVALNDYAAELPMSDASDGSALIAYHIDGKTMSVREKGPLWVVYPFSSDAKYRKELIYSRSIWQLSKIEVLD